MTWKSLELLYNVISFVSQHMYIASFPEFFLFTICRLNAMGSHTEDG